MNNRIIKFRAWCKDPYFEKYNMLEWRRDLFDDTSPVTGFSGMFPKPDDEDVTLMQHTGLHGIYEADILGEPRVGMEDEVIGVVKYDEDLAAFVIEKTNGGWEYLGKHITEHRTHKVIGNIYSNPELIKQ
jgi:uncharacterized phage protein (TIGR01671 family)